MALTKGNNNDGSKLYFLKFKSKNEKGEKVPIYIEVKEKGEGKEYVTVDSVDSVSGDLSKITVTEYEWEGKPKKNVKLLFKDKKAKENYLLDLSFSMTSRGLFNGLLSLDSFNDIKIGVYTNKKGFPATSLEQAGERVSWKFALKDIPEVELTKNKKGEVVSSDYSDVDAFFEEHLVELSERIAAAKTEQVEKEEVLVDSSDIPEFGDESGEKEDDLF